MDYQALFDNMLSGFAYHKILTDPKGKPVDYIFLEVNKAFEQFTGLKRNDIIGKKVTEVHPGIENMDFDWIGTYGRVALTGKSVVFEQFFEPQNSWYLISAFCPEKDHFALTFENITDRKKSKESFRELFERMPSGVAVYEAVEDGRDFIFKDFNQSAEKIEKIDRKNVIGKRVTEAFPGVKDFGVFEMFQRVWRTGKPEFHPEALYKNGRDVGSWRETCAYKLSTGDIVAVYNDVTERKQARENLQEALLRLRETVKAGNIGLWDWDLETNQVNYSAEWKSQIGYDEQEIEDDFEEWRSRVHPDDLAPTLESVNKSIARQKNNHKVEFRFRHKDGTYRWILAYGSILRDETGRAVRMLGSHVDITERKQAEERLADNHLHQTTLVDNLIDAIVVVDQNGTMQFVNTAACLIFGREKEELIGAPFGLPVSHERLFEIETNPRGDKIRYAEAKSTMITWGGEESYLISLRDITEKRRALIERDKMNEHLMQVEKIESIGNLAGGIAHDFNNMLSVIIGYGEELVDALHATDPLHESAREIVAAGRRSAELTRQLLAFSRRQTLQPEVLDLNFVIQNLENMLRRLIGEDIDMTTKLPEGLAHVEVDPGQIQQVIVNLAVNARDAMPQGGKLTIETANIALDDQYAGSHVGVKPGEYVMLSISDNGYGMDEKTRSRIFEPFFTTKEKDKGTGLGLSTAYGIVKQSGGNIWVYSEPGQGTIFKIYLPRTSNPISGEKQSIDDDSIEGKGEMVLVVEDEPSPRKLCERILKLLNYSVTVAANGGEALLLVEEKKLRPDLIITDVVMPEMSGKVLIDRLKNSLPDLKVLYMSGYTDNAIVHHGVLDSGTPFIQKPFSKAKLGKMIRQILNHEQG